MSQSRIFRPCELGTAELAVVDKVRQVKETLGYAVAEPRRWSGILRRNAFARAIQGSNSIEGYVVSVDDAIAAAEGEDPLEADDETWAAVQGYRQAMTYVMHLAHDPHFTFSADLIRGLHYMMMQYDLSKNPGRWRPGPIYVRNETEGRIVYEGPDAEHVPHLVAALVDDLQTPDTAVPPVVRAAMAHLNLAMIHPFSDGNGRMARCLQTLVLARTGTLASPFSSIEEYLGRNTQAYYDVLAQVGQGAWRPRADTRPWIRFCLTAHFRQATTLLKRSRELERLWNMIEGELVTRKLPDRLIYALAEAALGLRVRNATYRGVADISNQQASRDLVAATEAGLLVAHGEKRGRFYVASPVIGRLRELTREDFRVPDPFEDVPAKPDEPVLPGLDIS